MTAVRKADVAPDARRLVFHIGMPKTGTSAIQLVLERNAAELARCGVHYAPPEPGASADEAGVSSGNALQLVRYLDPRRRPEGFSAEAFERSFDSLYVSPDLPVSVISSEFLASASHEMLQRLRDRIVKDRRALFVAAVRSLYGHAQSAWIQLVKREACADSFRRFAEARYENSQLRALRAWSKVFGRENLSVIAFDAHSDDIAQPFFHALGVASPSGAPKALVNRSLSRTELKVQLLLNRLHGSPILAAAASDRFLARHPDRIGSRIWDPDVAAILQRRFGIEIEQFNAKRRPQDPELAVVHPRDCMVAGSREAWPTVLAEAVQAMLQRRAAARRKPAGQAPEKRALKSGVPCPAAASAAGSPSRR